MSQGKQASIQPIKAPANQPNKQHAIQGTNQPTHQLTNMPTNHTTNQPTSDLFISGVVTSGNDPKMKCVCVLSGYHNRTVYDVDWYVKQCLISSLKYQVNFVITCWQTIYSIISSFARLQLYKTFQVPMYSAAWRIVCCTWEWGKRIELSDSKICSNCMNTTAKKIKDDRKLANNTGNFLTLPF